MDEYIIKWQITDSLSIELGFDVQKFKCSCQMLNSIPPNKSIPADKTVEP